MASCVVIKEAKLAMSINSLVFKIKRGETPAYRRIRSLLKFVISPKAPRIPRFLTSPLRIMYELHFAVIVLIRMLLTVIYRHPLFQARCASVGRNLSLDGLPFVQGNAEIHIGNDVYLGGQITIMSARSLQRPRLVLENRVELGWRVSITVNREVVIEEYARVSFDCRISDSDGHPREADLRAQNAPVDPKDIRPVRICRHAWIGNASHIMKGVTIGEGAVIGANSVVISDIPPYCLAMGNPAEVYFRNFGRPSKNSSASAK